MKKPIFILVFLLAASVALAQQPTLVKLEANGFVKMSDTLKIRSVASDPDGDEVKLICGTTSGGNDICSGSFAQNNPECDHTVQWNDNSQHTIYCFVQDSPRAGHNAINSEIRSIVVTADNAAPSVSVAGSPAQWQNTDAAASVQCSDAGSGCGERRVKVYNANPVSCPTTFSDYLPVSAYAVAEHSWLCAAAKDNVGNTAFSAPSEFRVDKAVPVTSITCGGAPCAQDPEYYSIDLTIALAAQDSGDSGLKETRYKINSGAEQLYSAASPPVLTQHGHYVFEYWSVDNAGNVEGRKSVRVFVNKRILTEELVVSINFFKSTAGSEVNTKVAKIRKVGQPVDFFAYMSCYTRDKVTKEKTEDCSEGKTRVTSFDIDTKTGRRNYVQERAWRQNDNWDSAGKRWRFSIDTLVYQSHVDGCADHDGVPGCGGDDYFPVNTIMPIEITYPDLINFIIPPTLTGEPNFTRSMPVLFNAAPTIQEDDGSKRVCNADNCLVTYQVDGGLESTMTWDDFANNFYAAPQSSGVSCDQYHQLTVKAVKVTEPDLGLQNQTQSGFFVNCVPKITTNPPERRLVVGQSNMEVFNVTLWNPLEAATFDIEMQTDAGKEFVLEWLSFACSNPSECTASDDTATLGVGSVSSKNLIVNLDIAGKSGVFPITFTASSGGKEYEGKGTLQIFIEGLSEFGLWQLALVMLAATAFIWHKPEIIKRKTR